MYCTSCYKERLNFENTLYTGDFERCARYFNL
jgi:hypothetical protein